MQIKYSFDAITKNKILRGAVIAATGSAAIGLLGFFGQLQIDNPTLALFVAWFVPFAVNVIKEWLKGK